MQASGVRVRGGAGVAATFGMLLATACGGTAPVATPAPPADAPAEAPPAEPAGPPAEPSAPEPFVYGVDLDTIQSGRFDQGKMWTFEFPPTDYIEQTYGFRPDSAWFAHARLGALRIPSCSASFVSPHGLVMTNHHCGREFVTQVSGDGESLLDSGFVARDLADERPVEEFEADQLVEIRDFSAEVNDALDALPEAERSEARDSLLEEIKARVLEERGGEDSGFEVEMVSLYNGARTSAYIFRRYTNAKLVMAPELQIGFFGGDPDNFTYPRYNLDFSFFRIYGDDGRPLETPMYFPLDDDGLQEGEAVFILGNPGSTSRLQTVAELEFRRDVSDRAVVELLRSRMAVMEEFMASHPRETEERDLRNAYFSLENSLKALSGQVEGLEDPIIIARRADNERDFQEAVEADPELKGRYGDAIARMAELQEQKRTQAPGFGAFLALTSPELASGTLHRALLAFQILSARQNGAPDDAIADLLESFRAVPQQPAELDEGLMAARFRDFIDYYGEDSRLVSSVLGNMSAAEKAAAVVGASVLQDSASAVRAIDERTLTMGDPALAVVRSYLPTFIEFQQLVSEVFPQEEAIAADLGRARFAVYGTDVPPDATFSLRIADGAVRGYEYNGTVAPPFTTLFGLYDRHYSHEGKEDWALPNRWLESVDALELSTPINFVSTADIIGGNSGSPVVDQELEVVGIVFDGNIESLPGDYIYLPELNRSVSVDVRAIVEALDVVYDVDRLVGELTDGTLYETEAAADAAGAGRR